MGLPPSSPHKLKSLGVEGLSLGSETCPEAKAVKEQAGGIPPVEHEAGQPAESGELLGHIPTRSPRPDRLEKLVGLNRVEATSRSPVRQVFIVGFLAERQDARQNQHHLGRVERGRKATKLDATSRAKLAEVDERILPDVDLATARFLGSFDLGILIAGRNHRRPAGQVSALGVLSVKNRRQAEAKASNFFAPVKDVGGGAGATGGASVNLS